MNGKLLQLTHDAGTKGTVGRRWVGGMWYCAHHLSRSKHANLTFPLYWSFPSFMQGPPWMVSSKRPQRKWDPLFWEPLTCIIFVWREQSQKTHSWPTALPFPSGHFPGTRSIWFFFLATGNFSMPCPLLKQFSPFPVKKTYSLKLMCKHYNMINKNY